ncbi:LemA family protein [Halomonas ramblicola]|uniref:LemA family protein n=1 Tax=Halomonas ramblicola TaxID=747349 RepID=UPI0025B3881E|nr:LemA family protein [Halomonas ramblicola]MDN3521499.1 LemA family protein [Halomonas ramblicola]
MAATRERGGIDGGTLRLMIILLVGAVLVAVPWLTHNRLVAGEERVAAAWADVESNLQRRADLVPNLVRSVQEHMTYESETLVRLVRERAEALSEALAEARGEDPARLAGLEAALSEELGRLMRRAGEHPELRSGDQFLRLQAQLEGSENRINVARMRYNAAVREYNADLRGFVGRWVADPMGLGPRDYFEASPDAAEPVELAF